MMGSYIQEESALEYIEREFFEADFFERKQMKEWGEYEMDDCQLPISFFSSVKEVILPKEDDGMTGCAPIVTIISYDPRSGKKNRYNVNRINRETGMIYSIGRELPISYARRIAKEV